ncbi:hypothetical protein SASPL_144225 [Salvia splendens]|uniref:Ubiquitin carboxyl-terminal hydrolase 36/42 n=1 Tax=Salvia splendens TaxID=180675 RepID=A0A8X8WPM2_SALSN|nr:hypothetical protein SASPL_144225 [Salvia splendens]
MQNQKLKLQGSQVGATTTKDNFRLQESNRVVNMDLTRTKGMKKSAKVDNHQQLEDSTTKKRKVKCLTFTKATDHLPSSANTFQSRMCQRLVSHLLVMEASRGLDANNMSRGFGGEKAVDLRLQDTIFIQHTFGGSLRSKRYDKMMDLTLEIFGWVKSLEDALTQFTSSEDLDGDNMYRCARCATYVHAQKELHIKEAPNILTVVLKRFQGNWFRVDDTEVQPVELSHVMSEGAYILFYMRSYPRCGKSSQHQATCNGLSKGQPHDLVGREASGDSSKGVLIREIRSRVSSLSNYMEFSDAMSSDWSVFTSSDDSSFTNGEHKGLGRPRGRGVLIHLPVDVPSGFAIEEDRLMQRVPGQQCPFKCKLW